jgi:DNA-directed RNA polymerase specialized sigma24 family protein
MADVQGMFEVHEEWLEKRCKYEVLKIRGWTWQELRNEVWVRFVRRAEAGWFDQRPTKSVEAQARTLMNLCIRHVQKARWRDQGRARKHSEDDDALARIPEPHPTDPSEAKQHQQELRQLLALVHEATSPVRGLCLLSRDVPRAVAGGDVDRAKAYKRGGSNMPVRPAPEAYALLDSERRDTLLVFDLERWKPVLGVIYYAEGPLQPQLAEGCDVLAGNVERQANRALADLQRAVAARQREEA